MIIVLLIAAFIIFFGLIWWISTDYKTRWQVESPEQYKNNYDSFFSSQPTPSIYKNVVATVWKLERGLNGRLVSKIENAYRDPIRNLQVGGDSGSLHMQGKAIDFQLLEGLRMSPSELESIGQSLNNQGLRVIFYPFKKGQPIHVQQDEKARTQRRIFYAARSDEKEYKTTLQEASDS